MVLQRRRRIKPVVDRPAGAVPFASFLGMILIVSSFFLYAASGLLAPWWGVTVLVLVWLVQFVLCCAWWTAHPRRVVWIGALSFPLWFCLLVGSALAFDWRA